MKSIQINIRISEPLAKELTEVCTALKISKADWIRTTLAKQVFNERARLLTEIKEIEELMSSDLGKLVQKMRSRQKQ
jgi:antitoxin component of RelBE/YafQ-DinJ toxin-antitoxin module